MVAQWEWMILLLLVLVLLVVELLRTRRAIHRAGDKTQAPLPAPPARDAER